MTGSPRTRWGGSATHGVTVAMLLWLGAVSARAQTGTPPPFRVVAPGFVAIQVRDADAASDWYRRVFGLEEVNRLEAEDGRYSIRILSGAGLSMELIRLRGASAPEHPHLGLFKHGIHVDDIDVAHSWFRQQGIDVDPSIFTDHALKVRSLVLRDPYGNRLQLFEACGDECPASDPGGDPKALGPFLDSLRAEHQVPGVSFALFDDEGVLFEHVGGVTSRGSPAPVGAATVFEAASISKPVFAYVVACLAQDGAFGLDNPLHTLVGELPEVAYDPRSRHLTPRILLTHQGGLPNWRSRMRFPARSYDELFPPR